MPNVSAFLGLLSGAMRAAHADFPKPVTVAINNRDKLAAAVDALPSGSHADAMAAVAVALLDRRDPLTDPEVTRLVVARALAGDSGGALAYGVQQAADARIVDAIAEHADKIIASLKRAVDAAGQTLAQAHEIFGDVDLGESALILKLGPAAAKAWAEAKEAQQAIRTMDKGWFAIGNMTGAVSASTSPTLRLANVSLEQFEQLGHKAEPWAVVRAGVTIDMATRTTITERVARLTREREEREARGAAAFGDEYHRTHGHGPSLVRVRGGVVQ